MDEMKSFLVKISKEAGILALQYWHKIHEVETHSKGNNFDIVTEADYAIEYYIRDKIKEKFPLHSIVGEEVSDTIGNNYKWIIDPIDGTVSFLHGQYHWGISIALQFNNQTIFATVNCPAYNLFFEAEKDKGATLNGIPIQPSNTKKLSLACVCTGFCCIRSKWEQNNLEIFNEVAINVQGIRRLGSIATDIAFVACGKLDACWEMNVNLYDVAAALLIAEEAGALVSDMSGGQTYLPNFPLVSNKYLNKELIDIFHKHTIPFANRRKK